jgi:uncharacterized protein YigE (DUF2233 family)
MRLLHVRSLILLRLLWRLLGEMHPLLLLLGLAAAQKSAPAVGWTTLDKGLDLATIESGAQVLRIDPHLWSLEFLGSSTTGEKMKTAKEWCQTYRLVAAINAGMFATDEVTHLGYVRHRGKVYTSRRSPYESIAAFDPVRPTVQPFHILDVDKRRDTMSMAGKNYGSIVQNLRLIKRPGKNVWAQSKKRWSEAALAEDRKGRILFVFSRTPMTMHDFDRMLLQSGIGVVAAQHLEGGPEAQLYIRAGGTETESFGSYETGFQENDLNTKPWPIPNVLGIRKR